MKIISCDFHPSIPAAGASSGSDTSANKAIRFCVDCRLSGPMPRGPHLTSSRELFPIDFDSVTIGICASEGHIAGVFFNILSLPTLGAHVAM
jgi:hypothetical protein